MSFIQRNNSWWLNHGVMNIQGYGIIYCIYQNLHGEDCQNLDYKVGDALSHSLELDRRFIATLNILQTNNQLNVNNFVLTAASLVPQCTCLHGDLITLKWQPFVVYIVTPLQGCGIQESQHLQQSSEATMTELDTTCVYMECTVN